MRRLDLRSLRFGGSSELTLRVPVEVAPFAIGGLDYRVAGDLVELELGASRVGSRLSLRATATPTVHGPCHRCLADAVVPLQIDIREYVHGGESEEGDELERYTTGGVLDVERWLRDALGECLGARILCREDCRGLCPHCGVDLNEAGADHRH